MMTKPIRIMLLRTRYPHWSGEAALQHFAEAFDPRRFLITERLVNDGDADFPVQWWPGRRALRGVLKLGGMPYYRLSDLAAESSALRRTLQGRVRILHYFDGEHSAQFFPALARLIPLRSTRTMATYHQPPDLLDEQVPRRVVRALDVVTVVAPNQIDWFARIIGPDRVRCILHPVNAEFFRPPARRGNETIFRCITVGHWMRDWNTLRRVAIRFSDESDVRFDVVTTRETGLEDLPNVTHHRGVNDHRLRDLYQGAHALLLPLTGATANNALAEGIACGLPVISSDIEAVRAYLPGSEAILVRNNDAEEMADAVRRLKGDAALREDMGRRARQRAEALALPLIVPQYERVYEELIS